MKAKQSECIVDISKYTFDSKTNSLQTKKPTHYISYLIIIVLIFVVLAAYFCFNKLLIQNQSKIAYIHLTEKNVSSNRIKNDDSNKNIEITYDNMELTPIKMNEYDNINQQGVSTDIKYKVATKKPLPNELVKKRTVSMKKGTSDSIEPIDKNTVEYTFNSTEFNLTDKDMEALYRIVEAEATDEDIIGKILIANVVLNRVRSKGFPSTVHDVVFQKINGKSQFSPLDDGRYFTVKITKSTKEAVNRALQGEDYSRGALFFVARSMASKKAVSWFDKRLTKVFRHGVHEFFIY